MNKKFQKSILLIYVITLIISIIGATYAYFTVVKVSKVSPKSEITSATSEVISFSIDNELNIYANQFNFQEGMSSLTSKATATAYMRFDGGTRVVKHKYDLILNIDSNDFVYTTLEENPELILTVKDPNGNNVTSIDGLNYNDGFDITNKTGKYYIAKEYPLETDGEVTQEWEVVVTFVNLDTIQDVNNHRTLIGHVTIERSENDNK